MADTNGNRVSMTEKQKVKEITDRLEEGLKELFESEKYKNYLTTMSKFHNYSFNNTLLITLQKPDASLVCGYQAWQKNFNRHVKKGEKAIRILAPAPYKIKEERDKLDPVTGENEVIGSMTYSEWLTMKKRQHGEETVDTAFKRIRRESSDRKQFEEYKAVLGKNAPKSFAKFQDLKYNDTEKWGRLKLFRRYKGRVPEATEKDFQNYLAVKATGVIGSVRVPPEKIDASKLTFRDEHAARHGCTVEDARGYVEGAYCSIAKKRWDGFSINFYSASGAAYVDKETMEIKTSFSRKDYDPNTKAIVEVFE